MKPNNRHENGLYKTLDSLRHEKGYWTCLYCGAPADTVDHVPPLSRIHDYRALGIVEKYWRVRCCSECNRLLGNSLQMNMLERIEKAKNKLLKKYSKTLKTPIWDKDEIDELSDNLKTYVEQQNRLKINVQKRIDHYDNIDLILEQITDC